MPPPRGVRRCPATVVPLGKARYSASISACFTFDERWPSIEPVLAVCGRICVAVSECCLLKCSPPSGGLFLWRFALCELAFLASSPYLEGPGEYLPLGSFWGSRMEEGHMQ